MSLTPACCSWMHFHRINWVGERNLVDNYKANRLVLDPNEGFGRNKVSGPLRTAEEREQAGEEHFDRDDGEAAREQGNPLCPYRSHSCPHSLPLLSEQSCWRAATWSGVRGRHRLLG
jgi:hypothetical protein